MREVSVPTVASTFPVKPALQISDVVGVEMIMIHGLEGNLNFLRCISCVNNINNNIIGHEIGGGTVSREYQQKITISVIHGEKM